MLTTARRRHATRQSSILAVLAAGSLTVGCLANTGDEGERELGFADQLEPASEEELLLLEEALNQDNAPGNAIAGREGAELRSGQEASLEFAELLRERLARTEQTSDAGVGAEPSDGVVTESEIALDLSLALVHSLLDGGPAPRGADELTSGPSADGGTAR